MAPPQSIFRKPEAKHYSVLHRSQRDPLINDPSSGERILHEIQRKNQPRTQDKNPSDPNAPSKGPELNSAAPSSYNILYDDPDYDYLQHLRPIGSSTDAIFIEKATTSTQQKSNHRQQPITLVPSEDLLPKLVQATPDHQTLSYQDHLEYALPANSAIPDHGLLPISDDPALREVLDALEDEAYIEEDTDDQFFDTIIKHGEIDPNHPPDEQLQPPHSQWESEIARFKSTKLASTHLDDTSSTTSEPFKSGRRQLGGQRVNRSATSARGSLAGSAFSMSSSAMFRNEGLTDLDDRFDQIEKEYQSDDDEDDDNESKCSEMTTTPKVREDFDAIMDEFLDRFEVLGGKMKPALTGKTPIEKLDTLRTELLGPSSHDPSEDDGDTLERKLMKDKILSHLKNHQTRDEYVHAQSLEARPRTHPQKLLFKNLDDDPRYENKWDCQTILSTYSNLENHPRVIKIREAIGEPQNGENRRKNSQKSLSSGTATMTTPSGGGKIEIDRITGFPMVDGKVIKPSLRNLSGDESDHTSTDGSEGEDLENSVRGTIKRDRNEDKESKKLRKAEVKAERAARRQIKKSIKQSFTNEKNKQESINSKLLIKKSVDIAGVGGKHVISLI